MSYKTRGNYPSYCIRGCKNRNKKCKQCYRYSEWEKVK